MKSIYPHKKRHPVRRTVSRRLPRRVVHGPANNTGGLPRFGRIVHLDIWMRILALAAVCMGGMAKGEETVKTLAHFHEFAAEKQANGNPKGWTTWEARAEIAPRFSLDVKAGGPGHG